MLKKEEAVYSFVTPPIATNALVQQGLRRLENEALNWGQLCQVPSRSKQLHSNRASTMPRQRQA